MSDFYVTLSSNSEKNNKIGDFKTRLPTTLQFDRQYEVALTNIIYPYTFDNISNETDVDGTPFNSLDVNFKDGTVARIVVSTNNFSDPSELVAILNYEVAKQVRMKANKPALKDFQLFKFNTLTKRCEVLIKDPVKEIKLSRHFAYLLGYENVHLKSNSEAEHPVHHGNELMYIYCNIIDFQIVSNTQGQLLKIVNLHGKYGESIEVTFNRPQYMTVLGNYCDLVKIEAKNDFDKVINFHSGRITLVLHFRPKRVSFDI